jgi:hypothetical protein
MVTNIYERSRDRIRFTYLKPQTFTKKVYYTFFVNKLYFFIRFIQIFLKIDINPYLYIQSGSAEYFFGIFVGALLCTYIPMLIYTEANKERETIIFVEPHKKNRLFYVYNYERLKRMFEHERCIVMGQKVELQHLQSIELSKSEINNHRIDDLVLAELSLPDVPEDILNLDSF